MIEQAVRILPVLLAVTGGIIDRLSGRIPNWLTIPGLAIGIALNTWSRGWNGTKESLLGAGLGLVMLLWFVVLRVVGEGDLKEIVALGAFYGPRRLFDVFFIAVLINALQALGLMIKERRLLVRLKNIGRIFLAVFLFRRLDPELTLDNPRALKLRFGGSVAIAVVLYSVLAFCTGRQ
jgi:prepilin peptidase CpaA